LLATVPPGDTDRVLSTLADAGIEAAGIGEVRDGSPPAAVVDGERYERPVRDDLYRLWE
jgi:hydrogenase maturation factor